MTLTESLGMCIRAYWENVMREIIRIDGVSYWTADEKEMQKRLTYESACKESYRVWVTAELFLHQNRNSRHDFSDATQGNPYAVPKLPAEMSVIPRL